MSLILDHNKIKQLKEYAESHRFALNDLRAIQRGEQTIPGDRDEYRVFCPVNYKVVFTIDETLTHKWVRHMSMSASSACLNEHPDRIPNREALRMVCSHLGFKNFDECLIKNEQFHKNAIEVFEIFNDQGELKLKPFGPDLFIETDHNLIVKMLEGGPICVAYLNEKKTLVPLTPEKIEICLKLGLAYVDSNL